MLLSEKLLRGKQPREDIVDSRRVKQIVQRIARGRHVNELYRQQRVETHRADQAELQRWLDDDDGDR